MRLLSAHVEGLKITIACYSKLVGASERAIQHRQVPLVQPRHQPDVSAAARTIKEASS